jgi:hypothetical protein
MLTPTHPRLQPIKHGIKVYALCCAESGYIFNLEVFEGKRDGIDGSPQAVIKRLLHGHEFELEQNAGRTMYTDSWYTSLPLLRILGEDYTMKLVGTVVLTKKKSRTADDYPFHKPPNPAVATQPRGTMRRAAVRVYEILATGPRWLWAQALTWKDKKLVAFLSSAHVTPPTPGDTVKRWSSAHRERRDVACHTVGKAYSKYMGAVDQVDRDIRDWGMTDRTSKAMNRVAFYLLDCNSSNDFRMATYHLKENAPDAFKPYCRTTPDGKYPDDARYNFQMDKAMTMINLGLQREWGADGADGPPSWARSAGGFVPCGCKRCFFCMKGFTTGIQHAPKHVKKRARNTPKKIDCTRPVRKLADGRSTKCTECYTRRRIDRPDEAPSKTHSLRHKARVACAGCGAALCPTCAELHRENAFALASRRSDDDDDADDEIDDTDL